MIIIDGVVSDSGVLVPVWRLRRTERLVPAETIRVVYDGFVDQSAAFDGVTVPIMAEGAAYLIEPSAIPGLRGAVANFDQLTAAYGGILAGGTVEADPEEAG